jgi:uncharacterized protein (DUF58 family)
MADTPLAMSNTVTNAATEQRSTRDRSATDLLSVSLMAKLERLQLRSRRSLVGHLQGAHRSSRRGTSLDFADYRPYAPGDDVRRIDEHLFARLNVLALKLFDAEDDLVVRIVIDTSGSMSFGEKFQRAKELAAALGFIALVHRDAVYVQSLADLLVAKRAPRRFTGRNASVELFSVLSNMNATGVTPLAAGLRKLLTQSGPPGLTIVVSDLLTPQWEEALSRLPPRQGSALLVHVLADEDLHPTFVGDQELVDVETGQRITVSLDASTQQRYTDDAVAWCMRVEQRCAASGVGYHRSLAGEPLEKTVLALLSSTSRAT